MYLCFVYILRWMTTTAINAGLFFYLLFNSIFVEVLHEKKEKKSRSELDIQHQKTVFKNHFFIQGVQWVEWIKRILYIHICNFFKKSYNLKIICVCGSLFNLRDFFYCIHCIQVGNTDLIFSIIFRIFLSSAIVNLIIKE